MAHYFKCEKKMSFKHAKFRGRKKMCKMRGFDLYNCTTLILTHYADVIACRAYLLWSAGVNKKPIMKLMIIVYVRTGGASKFNYRIPFPFPLI